MATDLYQLGEDHESNDQGTRVLHSKFRRDLHTRRDKRAADPLAHAGRAGVVPKEKARETSAIEGQIRGHGCGVVVLKATEQHITAEQDYCQQAIHKIERPPGLLTAHFAGVLAWRTDAQLFAAVFESSASTPAAQARANE
jgi:hypothetical protein